MAVERVVEAYHQSTRTGQVPRQCLWDEIRGSLAKTAFFEAMERRDVRAIQHWLGRMFQTDLIWGLGKVHEAQPVDLRTNGSQALPALGVTDFLVSLGQAVSAQTVVSIQHQGYDAYAHQLDVDVEDLLRRVEAQARLDVSLPPVGAAYGCRIGSRLINMDSLLHSYSVHRLRQLGAQSHSTVVEIGGGYGCLAALAHRSGLRRFTICDLPWVNALQGYFLLMALPPRAVSLYGEAPAEVQVLPFWTFEELADRSADFVVNTDSLPEMALETRKKYIAGIARVLRGLFLSVNQESSLCVGALEPQSAVAPLIDAHGGFRRLSRHLYWMCQGYVEEIYAPIPS
ncbi:MAG: putative sugar O-methyltransferase [Gemmataceae bacterium]|nr:putative sugar O-methyltransferase [Gemmataceae bacterium]